jgi:hypothetical protein
MTKPDLENELGNTLRTLADAYEPAVFDATDEATRRRRVRPIIVAAAAALVLLAGLAVALTTNSDSADDVDVDVRGEPEPTTPTPPTETVEALPASRPDPIDTLDGWRWTIGAPAPGRPPFPELVWNGDEIAIFNDGQQATGYAYRPASDSWRDLSIVEVAAAVRFRDDPDARTSGGYADPTPSPGLGNIVVGTVMGGERPNSAWILSDWAATTQIVLPAPPVSGLLPGSPAIWTGQELFVWAGSSCLSALCGQPGPLTPFILRPPDDVDTSPATTEELSATWILSGIEIDGERIDDDEPATVSLDFSPTTKPNPLPVAVTGWAGCDYAADLLWPGPSADLQWPTAPEPCARTVSEFAGIFRSRLAETTTASVVDTGPAPVLWLEGPGLRIILVPATSTTVPGVLKIIDGAAPGPFELDCLEQMFTNYDYGEGAGSPTMLDEARRVLSIGTWYVEGNRMATFDENGVATRILNFSQGADGSWVREGERTCQPDR